MSRCQSSGRLNLVELQAFQGLLTQLEFMSSRDSLPSVSAVSPLALAYLGDAVYELYMRSQLLMPLKRIRDYHQQVVDQVKAEQQADYVDVLLPYLSPVEHDILRRGRNASTRRHSRVDSQTYQKATAFEALLGYLYLHDQPRLFELLNQLSQPT
ncbi:Mini-ribonuclease 3 [Romeria aff. gracilis LEGE 07310]|uniref:Mini-ribonuclease 3 n=2 Tax=Vasconcelosia TaxID=3366328 RepID=A0A8J7DCQ2_9CYAN|nr:Mini-ribonuclease 3 [Romeria aff. gracilis LEGE 07310]